MTLNYGPTGATKLNLMHLAQLGVLTNVDDCIKFLREHQLLVKEMNCPKCASSMREEKTDICEQDGCRWRCSNSYCKNATTIRKGSIFEKSKIGLVQLVLVLYFWAADMSQQQIAQESKVDERAVMDWVNILRNICLSDLINNGEQVGGTGHIVSIDKTRVPQKCCADVQGQPAKQQWLFGGIDHSTKKVFVELVPERGGTVSVEGDLISRHIARGTTIWSKKFAFCKRIEELGLGYTHTTINCGHENIPEYRIHSNNLQSLWMSIKMEFEEMKAVPPNLIPSYLGEWLWRRQYPGPRHFVEILRAIAKNPL